MKNFLILLIIAIQLNSSDIKTELLKEIKMCASVTTLKEKSIFEKFDFYDPLAFATTKNNLTIGNVQFNRRFQLHFLYGKLSSLHITTTADNFKDVKNTLEQNYNKKFTFIKSSNKEKMCDYYKLNNNDVELQLTYACGSKNSMSLTVIKHCKKEF